MKEKSSNKSIQKISRILQCFTPSTPSWTATNLAHKLNMPVTTLYGILSGLVQEDFLSQSPVSKEYRVGFKYMEMGFMHSNNFELNNIAHGIMRDLVFKTGYLVGLSVIYQGWMYVTMSILPLESTSDLRYTGPRLPAHITAGGKAILAHLSPQQREAYCNIKWQDNLLLPSCTPEELEKDSIQIKERGYSFGNTFINKNTTESIGSPVFGREGKVIASLVLISPSGGFPENVLLDLSNNLIVAAREITMCSGNIIQNNNYI